MDISESSHFLRVMVKKDGILFWDDDKEFFWDVTTFRPDPRVLLTLDKEYTADVIYDYENLSSGELIFFPRKIIVLEPRVSFVNVR